MIRTIVPNEALGLLREIGDEDLDTPRSAARAGTLRSVRSEGLGELAVNLSVPQSSEPPIELELDKLAEAQRLFARFGTEIGGALLLAALPQSYATAYGAGVLMANAELEKDLGRRIRRTAEFLLVVMQQAKDDNHQRYLWDWSYTPTPERPLSAEVTARPAPWRMCRALREYHQGIRADLKRQRDDEALRADGTDGPIRRLLGPFNKEPLNQEDLLGMLLTFSVTVFEVLERYGMSWTADQQEAYLHAWDVIGAYMGIGTPEVVKKFESEYKKRCGKDPKLPPGPITSNRWHGLRPPSVDDTRVLLDQIRARQWLVLSSEGTLEMEPWSAVRAGRILTRALLDELAAAMPRSLELVPITIMRALAPEVVRTRLALGDNGLVVGALSRLPKRAVVTERFTVWRAPNAVAAGILHLMANDVTTRAAMRFIKDGAYTFPGSGDWS